MTSIVSPGVYDLPDAVYHRDPVPGGSLSSSGARRLLAPSCPALFEYERKHGRPPRREFDLGHAAHLLVLGAGPELVVIKAKDYKTKAAREERDAAYGDGKVPVLAAEHEQVQAMAAAIRAHPIASALFHSDGGLPEQSLFWVDEPTGVWRRARPDWLPSQRGGRLLIPDYKTTVSAEPRSLARSMANFGYFQQAAWYLDGIRALGLAEDTAFLFVCQEKTPPHLVTVVELDYDALRIGHEMNRKAIEVYAECTRTGHWPGYSDDVELISLPPWAARQLEEAL